MPQKISIKERREVVKSLWNNGTRNVNELHKITKFPLRTLYRWSSQLKKTKNLKQRYHSGCPKVLSPKKRRQLARSRASAISFKIADTLNNTYPGLNIATRIVRENLWKFGYRDCVPKKTPFLTSIAKERRVSWAE
ncbi:15262_t:CDS:1, partial [Funneliformis caledonium]